MRNLQRCPLWPRRATPFYLLALTRLICSLAKFIVPFSTCLDHAEREIKYKSEKKYWEEQHKEVAARVAALTAEMAAYRGTSKAQQLEERIQVGGTGGWEQLVYLKGFSKKQPLQLKRGEAGGTCKQQACRGMHRLLRSHLRSLPACPAPSRPPRSWKLRCCIRRGRRTACARSCTRCSSACAPRGSLAAAASASGGGGQLRLWVQGDSCWDWDGARWMRGSTHLRAGWRAISPVSAGRRGSSFCLPLTVRHFSPPAHAAPTAAPWVWRARGTRCSRWWTTWSRAAWVRGVASRRQRTPCCRVVGARCQEMRCCWEVGARRQQMRWC